MTHSEQETADVGRQLAQSLEAGDVVLLCGDLGAGKTAFVKGLAEGLDIAREEVSSPTFTLIQEYRGGRLPLYHADLYRINDPREIEDLGLDEIAADGVLAIEWAEKLPALSELVLRQAQDKPVEGSPSNVFAVRIDHADGDLRTIRVNA